MRRRSPVEAGPGVSTRVHPDNIDTAASVSTQGPDLGLACNAGPASDTAALRCTSHPSLRGKQRTWVRIQIYKFYQVLFYDQNPILLQSLVTCYDLQYNLRFV